MLSRHRIVAALVLIPSLLFGTGALANGINPPRTRDGAIVRASCVEASSGRRHDILRARIAEADKNTDLLTLRFGEASEQVALVDLRSVALVDSKVDGDGFTKVRVVRRNATSEDPAALQVRVKGVPLRLRGFDASGSSASVELGKCKTIDFAPVATSTSEPEPTSRPKD